MSNHRPMTFEQLKHLPPIEAVGEQPIRPGHRSFYVHGSSDHPPKVTASAVRVESARAGVFRIDVETKLTGDFKMGPPPMGIREFHRSDFSKEMHQAAPACHRTAPHRPSFVPSNHVPVARLRSKVPSGPRLMLRGKPVRPLNIFQPDLRQQLFDQSYPWRTVGQTVSPVGDGRTFKVASGTLVGPRHILTASHCVGWNNPGGPSMTFAPAFSGGTQPFGQASGIQGYSYREIPNSPQDQLDVSEDYVVIVLDQRLGDELGWLGTRDYSTDWDNQPFWFNIGYPSDLGNGQIPFWQNQVSFEDADNPGIFGQEGDGLYMDTESASLAPGNSGGPFFANWDANADYPGWHIISVASSEGTLDWTFDDDNWAAGGNPMVDLVNQARNDFP